MLPIEIDTPTCQHSNFNKEENGEGLRCNADQVEEMRVVTHIQVLAAKQIAPKRYNSRVI